ncbi:ABC transporter ATP-binding protein/permease [Aggregatibacter actinomycetemcomitans]|nr:ABC transporter ATP-binding protein/permease [Aggregatibacter actinomycetemcomitans]
MRTLIHFYQLIRPYWCNPKQWLAWLLLFGVLGFSLLIIEVSVYINHWNKAFYDALTAFETDKILPLSLQYLGYMALIVLCVAVGSWLRKLLIIRWRHHLTRDFENRWLTRHNQYRLTLNQEPDNPDQRIAEDVAMLAEKSLDLLKNLCMNLAKIVAFIGILWQISGVIEFNIGNIPVRLPGYLVWLALIYTLVCSLFTHFIGRRLLPLNVEKQQAEADYRRSLLNVHNHAEQIAFYQGEQQEQNRLQQRFSHIVHNWRTIMGREFKLEVFTASYLRITNILPLFAVLPLYLAKTITFGTMMQARSAFASVQDGFGWFMDFYKRIMEWAATVQRLWEFQQSLATLPAYDAPPKAGDELICEALEVVLPNRQKALFPPVSLRLQAGDWLHLQGASGIGKTSLLRTLAGLWQPQGGSFSLPEATLLFLPQKSYLAKDRLDNLLCYPKSAVDFPDVFERVLLDVGLAHLAPDLTEERDWAHILSGGEQQRIAFARALIQQPQLIFFDETANQLDTVSALHLFSLLKTRLPRAIVIGITHQNELTPFFNRHYLLQQSQTD